MLDEMTPSLEVHAEWSTVGNEVPGNGLGNAWCNTAKPGEQISLKEHVERMMEGQNDADDTMGEPSGVVVRGSSQLRGRG